MLAALGALLGAAAAAPSENQPAHATLLFAQRAKAELADWQAQAKHAKLQAEKAEEEAVAAEKEYRKALELEASRRAFLDSATTAADKATKKAMANREAVAILESSERQEAASAKAEAAAEAVRIATAEMKTKTQIDVNNELQAEAKARLKAIGKGEAEAEAMKGWAASSLSTGGTVGSHTGVSLHSKHSDTEPLTPSLGKLEAKFAELAANLQKTEGRQVLWYQFQIPKAAGAEVSLLAMQLLCEVKAHTATSLWNKVMDWKHHKERCALECPSNRLVDTQFSCVTPDRKEQQLWQNAQYRLNTLLLNHKTAKEAVVFTVIREPSSRVVAHWVHCENEHLKHGKFSHGNSVCSHGAKAPPAGTPLMSNESFSWFLKQHADGPDAEMVGWDNGFRTSNMQVGMLASVPKGVAVTRNDLKKAKRILSNDNGKIKWVVGTTDTMHEFYLELAARAGRNVTNAEAAAATQAPESLVESLNLQDAFRASSKNQLDQELYDWVLERQASMKFSKNFQLQDGDFGPKTSGVVGAVGGGGATGPEMSRGAMEEALSRASMQAEGPAKPEEEAAVSKHNAKQHARQKFYGPEGPQQDEQETSAPRSAWQEAREAIGSSDQSDPKFPTHVPEHAHHQWHAVEKSTLKHRDQKEQDATPMKVWKGRTMKLQDGALAQQNGTEALKNPTILVVQDQLMVLARRVTEDFKKGTGKKNGRPTKIFESSLVAAWMPLEQLFATGSDFESERAMEFVGVPTHTGKLFPCIPDGSTELTMGPEDPRLFVVDGIRFLLDFRPPLATKRGVSCADFCGRVQPYITPIDEDALSRQELKLKRSQQLLLDNRNCGSEDSEKNWTPLKLKDRSLYMSRNIGKTHEIVSIVPPLAPNGFYPTEQHIPAPMFNAEDRFAKALALEGIDLRGGSPFVEIDHPHRGKQLLSIVHTKRFDTDSYENMAITANPDPPFALTSIGRPLPLGCKQSKQKRADESICFASGLQVHDGHIIVSFSSGDSDAKLWVAKWFVFLKEYLDLTPDEESEEKAAKEAESKKGHTQAASQSSADPSAQMSRARADKPVHEEAKADKTSHEEAKQGEEKNSRFHPATETTGYINCDRWTGVPESDVEPMECGALVYLHMGLTGGATETSPFRGDVYASQAYGPPVSYLYRSPAEEETAGAADNSSHMTGFAQWFYQAARKADYEFYDLFSSNAKESTPLSKWPVFQRLQNSVLNATKPKVAVQMHHMVPGLGDKLWEEHLLPWRQQLQSQGCELRVTTVLRSGRERLRADFDSSSRAGYTGDAMEHFCKFAKENANSQTKYLISGSKSLWPEEQHRLDPEADAELLPKARRVLEEMFMVGRFDRMDGYLQQLRNALGLPHHKLAAPSASWGSDADPAKDWSAAPNFEWQCLDKGASVDDQLFKGYCSEEAVRELEDRR